MKFGKGFKSKGWKVDKTSNIRKGNIMFKSGGISKSLDDIYSQNREKGCEFSWEEMAIKKTKRLAPYTKGGLGHSKTVPLIDNARLTEKLSDEISQKLLDKLISVQLIVDMHDGVDPKVKMLYFLQKLHSTHAIRT